MSSAPEGKVRFTRSGVEFREVTASEVTAGFDEGSWWHTCPRCNTALQGGAAAVAEHEKRIHAGS